MGDIFRVCIMGRHYDIPTSEISTATLEALKSLADESNNINPRDLLRVFLEYSEINCLLKNTILQASQKIYSMDSNQQEECENKAESLLDEEKSAPQNEDAPSLTQTNQ